MVVTTLPASRAPNAAMGYSGTLGKHTAIISPAFKPNFCCKRMASAAE